MVLAHVAGLPVEETAAQFAPVAIAFVVGLRMARGRVRGRVGQRSKTRWRAGRGA